jgi:hypothetical protein
MQLDQKPSWAHSRIHGRDLAFQQRLPGDHFAVAARIAIRHQPNYRGCYLLALARFAALAERAGFSPAAIPLEFYRH